MSENLFIIIINKSPSPSPSPSPSSSSSYLHSAVEQVNKNFLQVNRLVAKEAALVSSCRSKFTQSPNAVPNPAYPQQDLSTFGLTVAQSYADHPLYPPVASGHNMRQPGLLLPMQPPTQLALGKVESEI